MKTYSVFGLYLDVKEDDGYQRFGFPVEAESALEAEKLVLTLIYRECQCAQPVIAAVFEGAVKAVR